MPLGPLDEYFQKMYGGTGSAADNEKMMADSNAQMVQMEELIAACMSDQGFEYLPVDYSSTMTAGLNGDELDVQWGTKEFAEQYGYGATTDPGGYQAAATAAQTAGTEQLDPNQKALEAMSESERTAFYEALYGTQATVDPAVDPATDPEAGTEMEYDWTKAGCQGSASQEITDGSSGLGAEAFTALQDDMTAMYEAVGTDPRLADVNAQWASCMADAGFAGFAAVGDGETSIWDEVSKVQEASYTGLDPTVEITEEASAAMEAETTVALAAITPREMKTAVADYTCREDVGYDKIQQTVNFELQQAFVDAHKTELDAWLEASTASKS